MNISDKWISVKKQLPATGKIVWCLDNESQSLFLGCRLTEGFDGWAKSDGNIYIENGEIVSDCYPDDLNVTHWCFTPFKRATP